MNEKRLMKMNDLVRLSGAPRTTIHFYLRIGLLHPPHKTGRTMAYYDETHLESLKEIQKMKMDYRLPTAFIKRQLEESGKSPKHPKDKEKAPRDPKLKRKQEIIVAAIKLFSEKGYLRTNIRDITDALGISSGAFYIYFPNKQDLFIEVVDDVIRSIIGEIADAIRKEKDFRKRAILRARVFFENYPKYSEILTQLRAGIVGEKQWPQQKVKKIYRELTEPLIREVTHAMEAGVVRKMDPDLLAYALIGMIEVMSLRSTLDEKYNFDQLVAFIEDLILKGTAPI